MDIDNHPVIVHVVHSLQGGGTEHMLVALLRAFDPSRFRHVVVTLREAGSLSTRLPDHVACRAIAARGRSWSSGLALAKTTRDCRAAVIHARNTGCWSDATVAGLLTPRCRLVLGFHGLETDRALGRRQRRWARCAALLGARFVSVSEAGRRQLCDQAGIRADRIEVLRNGVNLRRFERLQDGARTRLRADFQFDDTSFVVGIVGSLTPVKQHTTLLTAVASLADLVPNIRLLVVGDGPLRAALSQQAQADGITNRVRFTGWREDIPALMQTMDVYVCSSASEGMNNAVLEAMAAGLPVIATNAGDNAIIARHGVEGLIVEPGCSQALAETLKVLAADPGLRRRLAEATGARAKQYDFDRTVRAYEEYYRTLLATPDLNAARMTSTAPFPHAG